MKANYSEQELLEGFTHGDTEAFKVIISRHYRALWIFANSIIDNMSESEDIVVNSISRLWRIRPNFDSLPNIKAFLYIVVRNGCLDYLRHVEVRRHSHRELVYLYNDAEIIDMENMVDARLIESEILLEITSVIRRLPPKMRSIFEMIYYHQLSTEEISVKLKISHSTIRVQKARAIKEVKLALIRKVGERQIL